MTELETIIDSAWDNRAEWTSESAPAGLREAVDEVLERLNKGEVRVAEKIDGEWVTHQWIKKAVLLSFRLTEQKVFRAGPFAWCDKLSPKFGALTDEAVLASGVRMIPGCVLRHGAYLAPGVVAMPSFVNVGAHVDTGTMIDTWATVGSCAQVGRNCHLSGGVGIGGVLEPVQAGPTIIEDNCFIGARSEIAEGVIVGANSVISMGCYIGKSTTIYDRTTGETFKGRIPAGSVVVSGNVPRDGKYSLYACIIVKHVDERTRSKTSINELLRD
ncbi:2,3,4,5-tetrahydropyridine-2,6-dicarboxylate N-succinyltransferase [Mesosutterella sp. OilRF-GAM-744-9]|uniref:2,3,4,5-tetrahydropyridine-2,6-dicarboxylate N-succinyltransferase n=1 Tax=Mesosutterella porci TaxID=2915351 RepID=A0ABS9MSH7_9BURK|nr:2,3,4,5-tetrahydropyridine-2,6-dicarboxylate N-succinyltransferase [Mesosutterella sp. oilRF-744-WT-GAM-9]MCG5030953.1 2,3,4,5-tetrahydropyridine-2,6-dicarboxylate N-succinyltransferase [Mesosutterella sp. oilRF-744-WT-GAM-9]